MQWPAANHDAAVVQVRTWYPSWALRLCIAGSTTAPLSHCCVEGLQSVFRSLLPSAYNSRVHHIPLKCIWNPHLYQTPGQPPCAPLLCLSAAIASFLVAVVSTSCMLLILDFGCLQAQRGGSVWQLCGLHLHVRPVSYIGNSSTLSTTPGSSQLHYALHQ
jgi:hypothetical protein